MKVGSKNYRTIWVKENEPTIIQIIDQRHLPHQFIIENISSVEQMAIAIKDMHVRGAGLIGAAAGFGMYLATLEAAKQTAGVDINSFLKDAAVKLKSTRPTAVNLEWAVHRQLKAIQEKTEIQQQIDIAFQTAQAIADEDASHCKAIGTHGLSLIQKIYQAKQQQTVNILTHCNAGWLAFVDYGSATAPMYAAHDLGIDIHIWVDETRPRNQGARLTAWELGQHGIPHTIITDNAGGHIMQHGLVDMVITGSDRTTSSGDVCNKIGTYQKALAAYDNKIPFYVALPSSTIDWNMKDGLSSVPIEERNPDEVRTIQGLHQDQIKTVLLTPQSSPAANYAFDVTPARLVTNLITERGICAANEESIKQLYPDLSIS